MGNFLSIQAMYLRRISSLPKMIAGLRIAYERPDSLTARSTSALPRKYGSGESTEALVMLDVNDAANAQPDLAASMSAAALPTARSCVTHPREKRIQ